MGEPAGSQVSQQPGHQMLKTAIQKSWPDTHTQLSLSINVLWPLMKCILNILLLSCVVSSSAQGHACVRRECTAPNAMSATQVSSTSAAQAAGPASVTTTPTTATHSPVSLLIVDTPCKQSSPAHITATVLLKKIHNNIWYQTVTR